MNLASKLRSFLFDVSAKKYWLALGLILAVAGQSLIREPQPLSSFKTITNYLISWNETFRLSLTNPINILVGLFLIMMAVFIHSRLFISTGGLPGPFTPSWDRSFWKKSLPWVAVSLCGHALVMIQLGRHQYSTLLFWIWLISILVFTFLFWKHENQNKVYPDFSTAPLDGAWMMALFALAIAAGSYLLNDLPAGWIADEGPFWEMARGIAIGEKYPPFFDFGVFTFPVASSILQGWIMRWAGVNMWGWRFASVLPAALTVIPLYLLAHELFDRRVAIAASVMMVVNPYFLTFARLGYNNSQSLFPVTLCIYLLVIGIRKNSFLYFWLAGLAAGFGFYTYFAAWLGLVVLVSVVICTYLLQGIKLQKSFVPLAIIFAGVLAVFLPRILYGMSGDTPALLDFKIWETGPINTFYGEFVFGRERIAQAHVLMMNDRVEIFYDPSLYGILLVRGFVRSAAALFDPIGYVDHQIIFGLTGPGSSIFFILGLGVTLANFKQRRYLIPSIWFLAGFFFLGVLSSFPPRPTHFVATIPALALISAIGLISFLDAFTKTSPVKSGKRLNWNHFSIASFMLIITAISFIQFFFLIPYAYIPPSEDDYISWLGRQISAPANIYLANHYSTGRNPMDESLLKLTPHHVTFLTRSSLETNPGQMGNWRNFVAFVDLKDGREFADWIAHNIPGSKLEEAYVPGQRLRGYIVTDIKVNTAMDISISHGLRDLWQSPALIILLSCGLSIIVFLLLKISDAKKASETL